MLKGNETMENLPKLLRDWWTQSFTNLMSGSGFIKGGVGEFVVDTFVFGELVVNRRL